MVASQLSEVPRMKIVAVDILLALHLDTPAFGTGNHNQLRLFRLPNSHAPGEHLPIALH